MSSTRRAIPRQPPGEPDRPPAQRDLLTVSEAARLLRVSRRTVERLAGRGALAFYELPVRGGLRFARADLDAWLTGRHRPSLGAS